MNSYDKYFCEDLRIIEDSLRSMDLPCFEKLLDECEKTIKNGHKIIASGLGKNVPICDKFVGTMLSLGLDKMEELCMMLIIPIKELKVYVNQTSQNMLIL